MPGLQRCRKRLLTGPGMVVLLLLGGCCTTPLARQARCPGTTEKQGVAAIVAPDSRLALADRLDRGYTIVLPGIWGAQPVDYSIVQGLQDGDVQSAVELYDWTAGALRLVYNLRAIDRNRREARKIAEKIVAYQDRYPGRPVHLVGYSGGGAMAVLTLEALPADRRVTDVTLLAPTLAADYDLRVALHHTQRGIHNFYSNLDVPILVVLCTAFGTTEGEHVLAAGAIGFQSPSRLEPDARKAYFAQVRQQSYSTDMMTDGHLGGHFGWSSRTFIAHHVAPLLAEPKSDGEPTRVADLTLPSEMSPGGRSRTIVR